MLCLERQVCGRLHELSEKDYRIKLHTGVNCQPRVTLAFFGLVLLHTRCNASQSHECSFNNG